MDDARLQVTDATGRRVVPLDKVLFSIGRRSASDLQVIGADVSRDHAEIACVDGQFVIRDRGSRFGTFVNDESITERAITHGDRIRLGRTDAAELLLLTGDDHSSLILRHASSGVGDLRHMAALLDGLRAIGSGRVLGEVLTMVMDLAIEATGAERGFLMLAGSTGALEFKVARLRGGMMLSGQGFETSRKLPEEVYTSGLTRVVADLTDDREADGHEGTIALGIRSVLCAPLCAPGHDSRGNGVQGPRVIGVLYLDGRERATLMSRATHEALETFATEAAMAIESARLYAESAEKARLDHDIALAGEMQRGLLPNPEHSGDTFDLAGVSVACRTIGGDFFDYFELEDGRFAFSLGDVAGKGPPAALLATAVQSMAAAQTAVTTDPAETLARINQALLRRSIQSRFATMFFGVLSADGVLRYSSAGHEPPVLVGGQGVSALEAGGLVLGLFPHATYESGVAQLAPGDVVVVCSDGVTEAMSASGEEFGRERLVQCVATEHGREPVAVRDRLLDAVRTFTAGAPQADDLTAVVVRYRGRRA